VLLGEGVWFFLGIMEATTWHMVCTRTPDFCTPCTSVLSEAVRLGLLCAGQRGSTI
jgi:hypothetical protein